MMVVADAGPLRYLIVIEAADVLRRLYDRVLLPETVAAELQAAPTPAAVRAWLLQPPAWCPPPILPLLSSIRENGPPSRSRSRCMPTVSSWTTGMAAPKLSAAISG